MRTRILILFAFLFTLSVFAQNLEPYQHKFWWKTQYRLLSDTMNDFKQRNFMLGWHWGGPYKITKALDVKQCDIGSLPYDSNAKFVKDCDLIIKPREYSHAVGPEILNARAIQWEPTLLLDSNNPEKLVIRQGDTTKPVFGFLHKRISVFYGFVLQFLPLFHHFNKFVR